MVIKICKGNKTLTKVEREKIKKKKLKTIVEN